MSADCSVEYRKKRFRYAKNFVTWLASKAIIPMPANLTSRKYKFGSTVTKVTTFTVDEVRTLVDASTGQLTLHLMINCGFTQQDVADLVQDEIDWKLGTITRKRSKTRQHEDVPTVTYRLWKRTFELLKQHRQSEGDLVLRTKSGQPWLNKRVVNGVFNRTDNTKSVYRHLVDRTGLDKPIKGLRKTSSSLLDTHPNAAEPQPKGLAARTTNAPRFVVIDVIPSAVHPALKAHLSGPLVHFSGCYGCRTSS